MKATSRLLLTCSMGALIVGTGSWGARAADMPVKAPVVVEEGWWWKSYFEIGGRGFLNDPKRDGSKARGTGDSLAKFYEYRDLTPGAFGTATQPAPAGPNRAADRPGGSVRLLPPTPL